jgi:hypothetical protein
MGRVCLNSVLLPNVFPDLSPNFEQEETEETEKVATSVLSVASCSKHAGIDFLNYSNTLLGRYQRVGLSFSPQREQKRRQ